VVLILTSILECDLDGRWTKITELGVQVGIGGDGYQVLLPKSELVAERHLGMDEDDVNMGKIRKIEKLS
jgi:hypothetical protein